MMYLHWQRKRQTNKKCTELCGILYCMEAETSHLTKIINFISRHGDFQNFGRKTGFKPIKYLYEPPTDACVCFFGRSLNFSFFFRQNSAGRWRRLTRSSWTKCCPSFRSVCLTLRMRSPRFWTSRTPCKSGKTSFFNITFYRPQRSCEGYVFTLVCQSFCSQGGVPAPGGTYPHPPGRYPPPAGTPPGRYTPWAGTPPAPRRYTPWQVHPLGRYTPPAGTPPGRYTPRAGTPHPPGRYTPGRRLLLRTVRILLECILVEH